MPTPGGRSRKVEDSLCLAAIEVGSRDVCRFNVCNSIHIVLSRRMRRPNWKATLDIIAVVTALHMALPASAAVIGKRHWRYFDDLGNQLTGFISSSH